MDMDIPLKKGGSKEELIEQSLPGKKNRPPIPQSPTWGFLRPITCVRPVLRNFFYRIPSWSDTDKQPDLIPGFTAMCKALYAISLGQPKG
jgi:hypothetical protein